VAGAGLLRHRRRRGARARGLIVLPN
jgi:hypothetical protein